MHRYLAAVLTLSLVGCARDRAPRAASTTPAAADPSVVHRLLLATVDDGTPEPGELRRAAALIETRLASWPDAPTPARASATSEGVVVELGPAEPRAIDLARAMAERRGSFEVLVVDAESPYLPRLCEELAGGSVESAMDRWFVDGARVESCYLRSEDRPALEARVARAATPADRFLAVGAGDGAGYRTYLLQAGPVVANSDVARARRAIDSAMNMPVVRVELGAVGAQRLAEATQLHRGKKMAMVIDGFVVIAPIVREAITGGSLVLTTGLGPGQAEFQALVDQADLIAALLSTPPLPLALRIGAAVRADR